MKEKACPAVSGFAPQAPSKVDMCALNLLYYYYYYDNARQVFIRMPSKQNSFDQKLKNHVKKLKVLFSLPITKLLSLQSCILGGKLQLDRSNIMTMKQSHSFNTAVVFFFIQKKINMGEEMQLHRRKNMAMMKLSIQYSQFKVCVFCVFGGFLVLFLLVQNRNMKKKTNYKFRRIGIQCTL